jgi:hypothetical protein
MILVDPKYNPDLQNGVNSATALAPGITVAKFLGAPGNPCVIDDLSSTVKTDIVRHLYLHAEAMRMINENTSEFKDVTVNVIEGVYRKSSFYDENLTGLSQKKETGRVIIYEVTGKDGKSDLEMTYDVAEFWKDYIQYDEVALDYDLYNPSGRLHAGIILEMPQVSRSWDPSFVGNVNTYFNGKLFKSSELVELLLDDNVPYSKSGAPISSSAVQSFTAPATTQLFTPQPNTDANVKLDPASVAKCEELQGLTEIPNDFQLSPNFTLDMLSSNAIVSKYPIKAQVGLSKQDIVCNLINLANNILEPILAKYSGLMVTSAFRHGTVASQHNKGEACDMQFSGSNASAYYSIANDIRTLVPHDQIILEYGDWSTRKGQGRDPWIHISLKRAADQRGQLLTYNTNRSPDYTPGFTNFA